jgi:MoxR-like ATPase
MKKMGEIGERIYVGDGKRRYEPLQNAWDQQEPYIAAPELAEAVNIALYLRRPLLLEGEPGCGKTQLAYAVAYELGYPLKPCYIRSTTRAQDLLYKYDAVKRFYDIQETRAVNDGTKVLPSRKVYVELGRLGEAIQLAQNDIPSVVLIDEIDKADIDFPNDLLLELDRLRFEVGEVKEYTFDALKGQSRDQRKDCLPLIIVTSNREKELPKPFLRRCLFHYIEFPSRKTLVTILKTHFYQETITPLFTQALNKFWKLRFQQEFSWRKEPGTSEFLDWVRILEQKIGRNDIEIEEFKDCKIPKLPFLETLVKTQSDLDAIKKMQI